MIVIYGIKNCDSEKRPGLRRDKSVRLTDLSFERAEFGRGAK